MFAFLLQDAQEFGKLFTSLLEETLSQQVTCICYQFNFNFSLFQSNGLLGIILHSFNPVKIEV